MAFVSMAFVSTIIESVYTLYQLLYLHPKSGQQLIYE
jgi:hypothetical protein